MLLPVNAREGPMGMCGVVLVAVLSQGGCTKDTDCKGERVCEAGVCVNPPALVAPPAPASGVASEAASPDEPLPPPLPPPEPPGATRRPLGASPHAPEPRAESRGPLPSPDAAFEAPSPDYPRVLRRGTQTCVQTLDAQGRVVESCRRAGNERPTARPRRPRADPDEPAEARGGFAFDLNARGSLLLGVAGSATFTLPAFSATLGLGGVSRAGVGAMALVNLDVGLGAGGTLVIATVAPALRLGRGTHVSLALGPTLIAYSTTLGSGSGLALSTLVQGVIQVAGGFSLVLNGGATFDASGVMFTLGGGLGFSSP